MTELKIEYIPVGDLVPYPLNTREHDDYDVAQIRKSIEQYGFNDPIGVWKDNIIIEGHGRLMAAQQLGMEKVPVIRLDHMTDEQRRAYGIMHNKTAELSAWDFEKLEEELQSLDFSAFDIDFDLPDKTGISEKDKRPEVPFTEVLGEESNYLVLKFDTEIDWLQACTTFDVKPVKALSTRKDGKITGKMTRIGVGRVLNGSEALERIRGGCIVKIRVCIPSYKRPKVETLDYIPDARVYVDEGEYPAYHDENPGADIVACPKGIQGNLCRIRNYIMRTEFDHGADVVCIIDDDMEGLYLWQKGEHNTMKKVKIEHEWLYDFLEKYSILCDEFGFKFWGGNCNQDALSYRAYTPFSLVSYLGGPFQVFLKGNECFYDERLPLKEDYDMTLQQCNKYHGCLRLNMLTYNVKQSEQVGGCASYRNLDNEKKQFELLQRKWGRNIVREDKSNKGHSSKTKNFDYNPIIKVPIKGV